MIGNKIEFCSLTTVHGWKCELVRQSIIIFHPLNEQFNRPFAIGHQILIHSNKSLYERTTPISYTISHLGVTDLCLDKMKSNTTLCESTSRWSHCSQTHEIKISSQGRILTTLNIRLLLETGYRLNSYTVYKSVLFTRNSVASNFLGECNKTIQTGILNNARFMDTFNTNNSPVRVVICCHNLRLK